MNQQMAVELIREAIMSAFWLGLPLLAVGLMAGILISLIQIVTSIQDPTFGSVPRLAAFLAALTIFLPWMVMRLCSYTTALLSDFTKYAR